MRINILKYAFISVLLITGTTSCLEPDDGDIKKKTQKGEWYIVNMSYSDLVIKCYDSDDVEWLTKTIKRGEENELKVGSATDYFTENFVSFHRVRDLYLKNCVKLYTPSGTLLKTWRYNNGEFVPGRSIFKESSWEKKIHSDDHFHIVEWRFIIYPETLL